MANRVKATEITPQKLDTHLKIGNNYKKEMTDYFNLLKKNHSSMFSLMDSKPSYEQFNVLEFIGVSLVNDINNTDSIFNDKVKRSFETDYKATSKKPEAIDFLGFFSEPKIETKQNINTIKKQFESIIYGISEINKKLRKYLTIDAIQKYIEQTNPIELTESGKFTNSVDILFYLSSKGKVPPNSYLTSLIKILSDAENFSNNIIITNRGEELINKICTLNGEFKNDSFSQLLNNNIAPYISNDSSIWEVTDFITKSTNSFINKFLENKKIQELVNHYNYSFKKIAYTNQRRTATDAFSVFAKVLIMFKYLEWYLSLGYNKLFKSDKSISTSNQKNKDSDGYITVNGKRFFDVKNATPEQIKKYQEQNKKEDKTIDNKSSDNEKTNYNKNSNTISQSSNKDKTTIKQLQNDIFIANSIIKNGKVPEEIPKQYNDGIIGNETQKLFKEFKNSIETLKDEEKPEGVEQNDNFGEYEKLAAKKIIDSYKEQSSAITGIVSGKPEMKDFLGVEGNDVANNFSEYIIQELINTKNDEVAWKLTNLFKTQFERSPSNEELDRAIQWIQKIKNERGADAWKISDHPQSNLA